jgi:nucleoside-diphosphate-sugar epimerase
VAGASGFIGSALMDQMSRSAPEPLPSDLLRSADPESLRLYLQDVEGYCLVFAIGRGSSSGAKGMAPSERTILFDKIWAARSQLLRADKVIWFGSSAEYGSAEVPAMESTPPAPVTSYGLSKTLETRAWLMMRELGVNVTVVRPTTVYGSGQAGTMLIPAVVSALRTGVSLKVECPDAVRDYIHVSDLAKATELLLAMDADLPAILNLGSGFCYSTRSVISCFEQALGRPLQIERFSNRTSGCHDVRVNSHLVSDLTGWRPVCDLESTVGSFL